MAVYVTVTQLLERYDWRTIADLVSDTDVPVTLTDLQTDTKLAMAIADASGDIDSALRACGRYSTTDLSTLIGNSGSLLQRICSEIVIAYLFDRRPAYNVDLLDIYRKGKKEHLDKLANGTNIFDLPAVVAAGVPSIDGPTTIEYDNLNLLRDQTRNYFPRRTLPFNR